MLTSHYAWWRHFTKKTRILQPRSQGLSSLPPLVVGTETLVAAGYVTIYPSKTAGWVGTQVNLVERKTLLPHPSSRFFYHPDSGWSRDQRQPGSLFQRLREAEKRDPGNEVENTVGPTVSIPKRDNKFE